MHNRVSKVMEGVGRHNFSCSARQVAGEEDIDKVDNEDEDDEDADQAIATAIFKDPNSQQSGLINAHNLDDV